jgi:hypothetical protein
MELKDKSKRYFQALGINPNIKGNLHKDTFLDEAPIPVKGLIDGSCTINIECFLFYTYIEVIMNESGYTFEGYSGGIGFPTELLTEGIIYYNDLDTLLRATTFGLVFISAEGGIAQVTWGTSGNATALADGVSIGAFAGSGNWRKST